MPVRAQIAPVLADVVGPGRPIGIAAYDGSTAGPADPVSRIIIRDHRALRYVATAPSDLGMARAYVSGSLDVEGDMFTTLELLARDQVGSLTWAERLEVLRGLGPSILKPIAPPPEETRPGLWWGWRHSLGTRLEGHQSSLRRFQPLLRVDSRTDDGVHVRRLPLRRRVAGGGSGGKGRPGLPQARLAARPATAGRRMRVGNDGPPRRHPLRGPGHRRDPVAPAGRVRPEAHCRAGPVGRGRDPPRRLPQRQRGRFRRHQQHRAHRAHRGQEPGRATSVSSPPGCARRAACSTIASPGR